VENFKEYSNKFDMRTRYLSLFKYINANFNYVPDSQRDEYFATAKETINNGMGGDCDDHSILMASAMASIGAKCRLGNGGRTYVS
jgi:transglutaminase-like putative cysteine protease